jgi:hypothetical protein
MNLSLFSGVFNSGVQQFPVSSQKVEIDIDTQISVVQIAYFTPGFTIFKPRKMTLSSNLWLSMPSVLMYLTISSYKILYLAKFSSFSSNNRKIITFWLNSRFSLK